MTRPDATEIWRELSAANEALDDSLAASEQGRLRTAVSRGYYACFHAARAVLWSYGVAPKTHKGLIQLFGERLVLTGLVSADDHAILIDAHEDRDLADYHAETESLDSADVRQLLDRVRTFVATMEELVGQAREAQ